MYEYFIVSFIFIFVILFAYIKIKYPFWNNQPVFHTYDFWRFLSSKPYVVYKKHPMKTKHCDFENIKTFPFLETSLMQREQMVDLLQCYYVQSSKIIHDIREQDLWDSLSGFNEPAFVSFYSVPTFLGKDGGIKYDKLLAGCICSRPMTLYYIEPTLTVYNRLLIYRMDYLCIHREHDRDAKISRKLFQTHEYNQRVKNPAISVSLFKKENQLCDGLVPLLEYKTYTYSLQNIQLKPLPENMHVVSIHHENADLLFDFLKGIEKQQFTENPVLFHICCVPDIGSLLSLIKSNLLMVFCLRCREHIYGWYFIKNPKVQYEDIDAGGQTLQCIASIMNCNSKDVFFSGFLHGLRDILKRYPKFSILVFENISHNVFLLNHWNKKNSAILENASAYYLYNFIMPGSPILPERVLVL